MAQKIMWCACGWTRIAYDMVDFYDFIEIHYHESPRCIVNYEEEVVM